MLVLHPSCAGLDVHKKSVVACCLKLEADGTQLQKTRTFGTTTIELLELLDWFSQEEVTIVAMESTGEYWKPVHNILEGQLEILLVNAQHVKHVPGRKTDVLDAQWLAELLQHGLLRASFIPPRAQRDLRDLTRQRSNLVRERASVINRLQKVLEAANLKLASVVSDIRGVSARQMLEAIIAGETDPQKLAELARGRMRAKRAELAKALKGQVRDQHCFLLTQHLAHLDFLDEQVEIFSSEIERQLKEGPSVNLVSPDPATKIGQALESSQNNFTPDPSTPATAVATLNWEEAVALLDTIPGIDRKVAQLLIAEIGIDMSRFPSAAHLASWAGVAPGNNRSAGKQLPGRISSGDRPVRKGLIQASHAAAKSKKSYLGALYTKLAGRRGKRRAIIAVAHSILVSVYYMFTRKEEYKELGYDYLDERKRGTITNRLIRRLERLGYQVNLKNPEPKLA
ncbi:MAG: IS110 family transposase [Bacteroidetes bacterium]|uniref:IS110 family transposase n=1 Tax=Candidatus Chlorohelix allophototropha TaxID=3003348 RepID=A0A8T7M426_9CHLR|nr:IS110 family transposase [Chloroflexota bacterium]NWJ46840.1 IS110 family transposase [Chloroflexota bacterium]NWJ53282.1 IS110 family transposase [Bacteroidota bacterium]WJW67570.1 IS110 family transposase [Chloroflexota bacterium L227-S17]